MKCIVGFCSCFCWQKFQYVCNFLQNLTVYIFSFYFFVVFRLFVEISHLLVIIWLPRKELLFFHNNVTLFIYLFSLPFEIMTVVMWVWHKLSPLTCFNKIHFLASTKKYNLMPDWWNHSLRKCLLHKHGDLTFLDIVFRRSPFIYQTPTHTVFVIYGTVFKTALTL